MAAPLDPRAERLAVLRAERVARRLWRPRPPLTLSQWVAAHRIVSAENSPFPGRWHHSLTPYLVEIMDACSDPAVERVVFKKSAQIGYTDGILNNIVAYYIDQLPSPVLVLQPTIGAANMWSKERLTPMLRDTPRLRGRVKESGRRDSKNTIQLKIFPGGYLAIVGANSAIGLRSRPIRVVLGDEIDGYGVAAKGGQHFEGDPLSLAITRTQNFPNRKIILGSTPTVKGLSRIEREYEMSDQRLYLVPCPRCGHRQALKWRNFRWRDQDPETVVYVCGEISEAGELTAGCGAELTEADKAGMVQAGAWVPQRPGRPTRGYFVWAAYSLFVPWPKLIDRWLREHGQAAELQAFVNQVLGETWEERSEAIDIGTLSARREAYGEGIEVPAGVGALTAGVDVQGDRLEVSVWGWGEGDESWLVRHETLWGNPTEATPWRQLDLLRTRPWRHETGAQLRILATAVDSGGHHTEEVYRYAKTRKGVFAVKGSSDAGVAPVGRPTKSNRAGIPLFPLGTVALKDSLFGRLKITALGPGYVHLPMVDEEYLRQLVAEVVRIRFQKGRQAVRIYEKTYERNEALDCAVYARAALLILGPVRERVGAMAKKLAEQATPKAPPGPPAGVQVPHKPGGKRNWATGY